MPKTLIIDATQDQFFMSNLGGGFKNSDLTIMPVHDALITDPKNIDARVEKFRDYDDIFLFIDRDDIMSQLSATEISENLLNDTSIMQSVFPDLLGSTTRYDIPLPVEWIKHEDVHEAITDSGARLESATEHEITIPYQDSSSENPTLKRLTLRSVNYFFQVNFHASNDSQTQKKVQKQSIPKYIGEKFLIPLVVAVLASIIGSVIFLWLQSQGICCDEDTELPTSTPTLFEPTDTDDEILSLAVEITETLNPSPTITSEPTVVVETNTPTHTPAPTLTPLPDSLAFIPAPDVCLTVEIPLLNFNNSVSEENCDVTSFLMERSATNPEQNLSILQANNRCARQGGRLSTLHEWLWAVFGTRDETAITLADSAVENTWLGGPFDTSIEENSEWVWYILPEDDPNNVGTAVWLQVSQGELVARFSPSIGDTARYSYRCYFDN